MSKPNKFALKATLLSGAAALIAVSCDADAQGTAPQPQVPNFIDARPVPLSDKGRAEEAEAKRKADEELKRLFSEADAKRRAEEEARRATAETEAKLKAEQEARRVAAEADAKRRAEDEARRVAAESEARRLADEADARRRTDEQSRRAAAETEANRVAADAEAKRRADEETRRAAAEAESRRAAAEAEARRVAAETEARRKADEESRRVAAEAEARRKAEDDARRVAAEADARRRQAEAEAQRLAAEADVRRKAEAEAAARAAASAPPVRAEAPRTESARIVVRGRQMLEEGDIIGARLIFDRAANAGDAEAAALLADSYDAAVLNRVGAVGVAADPALAARWRARARELGAAAAAAVVTAAPPPVVATPPPAAAINTAVAPPAPAPVAVPVPVPVTRPPEPAAPAISAEAQRYIARGRTLMLQGDIDAARLFFQRALADGAALGALELGATYDPVSLAEYGVVGLQPDPARAAEYYRKAQQLGASGAAERLARLGTR